MAATNDGRAIAGGPAQPVYITNAAGDPVPITGGGGGGGGAVTIADGADITQGAKADAAATTDAGTFSLIALFKRLLQKLTTQLPAALAAGGGLKIEGVAGGVAMPVQATNGTLTDRSGTITTGGTRQQIAASNSSRKYFFFQNQSSANLWLRFTGNATQDQSSMRVAPGDSWESPAGFVSTQAVDVVGATTGQAWHAVEA